MASRSLEKTARGAYSEKLQNLSALNGALDGSEDDQILCIKYGPYKDLLARLQHLEESDIDPFEAIPDDDVLQEDVAD